MLKRKIFCTFSFQQILLLNINQMEMLILHRQVIQLQRRLLTMFNVNCPEKQLIQTRSH